MFNMMNHFKNWRNISRSQSLEGYHVYTISFIPTKSSKSNILKACNILRSLIPFKTCFSNLKKITETSNLKKTILHLERKTLSACGKLAHITSVLNYKSKLQGFRNCFQIWIANINRSKNFKESLRNQKFSFLMSKLKFTKCNQYSNDFMNGLKEKHKKNELSKRSYILKRLLNKNSSKYSTNSLRNSVRLWWKNQLTTEFEKKKGRV